MANAPFLLGLQCQNQKTVESHAPQKVPFYMWVHSCPQIVVCKIQKGVFSITIYGVFDGLAVRTIFAAKVVRWLMVISQQVRSHHILRVTINHTHLHFW